MLLLLLFTALFLLFFGMSIVFIVYICLMWSMALHHHHRRLAAGNTSPSKAPPAGLTPAQLASLGGAEDGAAVAGEECVVCLEDIEGGQAARVLPECRHAFHRGCADRWLALHSDCPLCRASLAPAVEGEEEEGGEVVVVHVGS